MEGAKISNKHLTSSCNIIREEGFFSFILKTIRYINSSICGISKTIIYEYDLETPIPKIPIDLDLSFRLASKKDIDSMDEEHYGYDRDGKKYSKNRLKKGDKCILALYNKKIVGYIWFMYDNMELSEYKLVPLSKNKAYSYKGFVMEKHRGKKIHWAMYRFLIDLVKKEGKRYILSGIDSDNKPAIKIKEKDVYKKIGNIIHFRFFGLRYDFIKKGVLKYIQNE